MEGTCTSALKEPILRGLRESWIYFAPENGLRRQKPASKIVLSYTSRGRKKEHPCGMQNEV
jgi:hypothetical protein